MLPSITNDSELELTLHRLNEIFAAEDGTEEAKERHILELLIEDYENQFHPIPPPTPLQAIAFAMDQRGLTRRDLEPLLGTSGRVSEILNGKRPLTLPMIVRLHQAFDLPYDCLIEPDCALAQAG